MSISTLIHQNAGNNPILLFIKNDECDACKIFYDYINSNFEALVLPKLPEDTQVYQININDFNSENMWLFHVLEGYSFPTVLYLDKNNKIYPERILYIKKMLQGSLNSSNQYFKMQQNLVNKL
ncbi:hypothetical protein [Flavobacterium sp. HJJ]|uniref:hypothetical protein n=1 Tax=Flavobacterium sp. HJJ TaxID=2783792 RepID=UPI00188A5CDE|nr:hypothetical protein [Flavobacterium sp. HJJ]MBF4472563.1 hypothetical protein [Flavobacterium sp. HJJ]